jgi:trigger factor
MKHEIKKIPGNQMEITIEVETSEIQIHLEKAATRLSSKSKIDGFRAGKAPYDIVKQKFGEGAILEESLNDIVSATYIETIGKEKLDPIDMPKIDVIKLAPNNPVIYKATISLLPKVILGDIKKIKVEKKEAKVDEKKIDGTLKKLAESRSFEKLVERVAKNTDIVEVDMNIVQANVPVEGGTSKNHKIIVGEPYYIPGFDKNLIGLKKGDKKEFKVTFPKEHFNKQLAGKPVICKIDVKNVYERDIPKINDEFAKTLGEFKNLDALKKQIKDNLFEEAKMKESQRQEIEMLEKLVKEAKIDELPQILIEEETRKMIGELEGNLANQGVKLDDYLSHLKKTGEDIKNEFLPQAKQRVETALLIKQYASENKTKIDDKEIEKEIEKMVSHYPNDKEVQEQIKSENYKNYVKNSLLNQKVVRELKKEIIK